MRPPCATIVRAGSIPGAARGPRSSAEHLNARCGRTASRLFGSRTGRRTSIRTSSDSSRRCRPSASTGLSSWAPATLTISWPSTSGTITGSGRIRRSTSGRRRVRRLRCDWRPSTAPSDAEPDWAGCCDTTAGWRRDRSKPRFLPGLLGQPPISARSRPTPSLRRALPWAHSTLADPHRFL